MALVGALLALWLVREREIERDGQVEVASPNAERLEYAPL